MLFLLSISDASLKAQVCLFSELDTSYISPTSTQAIIYTKIVESNQYSELSIIQMKPLDSIQMNGRIKVFFSGSACDTLRFMATNVEYHDEDDYLWYGYMLPIDSADCLDGDLFIGSTSGQKFGSMRIGGKIYTFEELGGGLQVLAKAPEYEGLHSCGATDSIALEEDPPTIVERTANCDIRVLTLYTDAVVLSTPDPVLLAQTNLAKTNQILKNSGLGSGQIHFVNAGIEQFSGLSETNMSFAGVLSALRTNSGAQARRSATDADVVVLLVDHNITLDGGEVAGVAYFAANIGSQWAFAVVRARGSDNGIVYAHELGHILGARHEVCGAEDAHPNNCDDTPVPGHAHTWSFTKSGKTFKRKTVMYSSNAPEVINHFSNYYIKYEGRPTGILNEANNASTLSINACTVANFWSEDQTLGAHIDGPNFACAESPEYFTATVDGAPGPYTYQWFVSYNGGTTFGNAISTSGFAIVDMPSQVGAIVVIKLIVSTGSQTVTVFKTVITVNGPDSTPCIRTTESAKPTRFGADTLRVFPNPASSQAIVEFTLEYASMISLDLFNGMGTKVKSLVIGASFEEGANQIVANLEGLPAGVYILNLRGVSGSKALLFTIAH